MKCYVRWTRAVALIVTLAASVSAQEAKFSINDVSWLAGCWEINVGEKQLLVTEQWMGPAGGLMIGAGRTVKGGKAVGFEFLRLVEEVDGIFYVAKPSANKDETRFRLVRSGPSDVTFENPTHDFPQRILYRRDGDKLHARIEGTSNGKTRGMDFPYVRAKCE